MSRARFLFVVGAATALTWAIAGTAAAADPSAGPSVLPSTAPSGELSTIVATNARIGEELVWWGLRLLIVVFVGMAIAATVSWLQTVLNPANAKILTTGGTGVAGLLDGLAKMLPALIKTPAGIGSVILLLGVVMLLGTASIAGNQLKDFGTVDDTSPSAPAASSDAAPTASVPASICPSTPSASTLVSADPCG
jgi:hypothetical protein